MDFQNLNSSSMESSDESLNFREIVEKYLIYWKWFVLSVIAAITFNYFMLRQTVPEYNIQASILLKESEKGNSFMDLSDFEDLGLFGSGGDNSILNQMEILKSRRLMMMVVKELDLNLNYFVEDSPYYKEQYPNTPIIVSIKSDSLSIDQIGTSFELLIQSNKSFEFFDSQEQSLGSRSFGDDFKADIGNELFSDERLISVDLNKNFKGDIIGRRIRVEIYPVEEVVNKYLDKLVIEPIDERMSNVLVLSLDESIIEKGKLLVNNLIEHFNADGIKDKNDLAQATTDFLDLRIGLLSAELSVIEGTAEQFKSSKKMVGQDAGSDIFMKSSSATEGEIVTKNTHLSMANYMLEELEENDNTKPLPGNIGLSDPLTVQMIGEFNNLVLMRNRILKSSSTINPIMVNIDSQLEVLKSNLVSSLMTLKSSLQIEIDALELQSGRINSRIAAVPKNEREFKDIVRQQETKNALYLFLLQKREESILSNAVSVNKAKIIDSAYSDGRKVSPKKLIAYLGSILIGLFIPFGFLYASDLLDTKVHDESDIKMLDIPFIGDIPLSKSKNELFISENSNSSIAEAFRYIRTNIGFMLDSKDEGKTIFVTSTQSHEGKTFTAINLASSLAISGKKTLLIGMDLRAPKIDKYTDLESSIGVTNFIKDESLDVVDIIDTNTKLKNLHVIHSGDIPPNPVELLMSKRVEEIFQKVMIHYDFIIVDTAPVGMVTDCIQISKFADLTIYVIKSNVLDKRKLHILDKMKKGKKLPNISVLINATNHNRGAYGYGYGYGDNVKNRSRFRRFFNS